VNDNEVTKKQALARTNEVNEKLRKLQESVLDNNKNGLNSLREIQELKTQIGVDWQQQQTKTLAVLRALRKDVDKLENGVGATSPLRTEIDLLTESMIVIKRQIEALTASDSGSKEKQTELTKTLDKLQTNINKLSATADDKDAGGVKQTADNLNDRVKALFEEIYDVATFNAIQKKYHLSILEKVKALLEDAFSDTLAEQSDIQANSAEAERYFTLIAETKEIEYQLVEVLTKYAKIMGDIVEDDDPRLVNFQWLLMGLVYMQEKASQELLEKVEALLDDAFSDTLTELDIEAKSEEVEQYVNAFKGSEASEKELGELLSRYASTIKEYETSDPRVVHFQWLAELYPDHDVFVGAPPPAPSSS